MQTFGICFNDSFFLQFIYMASFDWLLSGDEDEEEEKLPSCMDYVMHFLTLFWKVLFACVPPTGISHSLLSYIVAYFYTSIPYK